MRCRWITISLILLMCGMVAGAAQGPRQKLTLDFGWKFLAGDPSGAQGVAFKDAAWRTVDLPHDWSIEGKIDPAAPMGGAGGFFPAGVGWYRQTIAAPAEWKGRRVVVEFEGVYMNANVWINGRHLGAHPYGYTGFFFDLTPHLRFGEKNTLAVRVDNSKHKNTRWYSGSGIYRHVWLHVTMPLHVAPWGVFVTASEVSKSKAALAVKTRVLGEGSRARELTLETALLGPDGKAAGSAVTKCEAAPGSDQELTQQISVKAPMLWSPGTPRLYRAVTRIIEGRRVVDEVETPFGIRSLTWSAEKGLELNGKSIELCGGCVHHDNGCLGAAAYDRAEERKVELLKAAGFNAIRTSHNPPSPALLAACDRLGMLVLDEAFDCWERPKNPHDYSEYFKAWWPRDIDAMVLRDRNHPSVFCWSIGNEVPERADALELTKKLIAQVKRSDPTRPVANAICDFWDHKGRKWPETDAAFALLDIGGYNYTLGGNEEADHARAPGRVMAATESYPNAAFDTWRRVQARPYIIGDFVWTALDYLGEAGIGRNILEGETNTGHGRDEIFPIHGGSCGDLDLNGFRKPLSHYRNIVWNRGEKLYIAVLNPAPEGKRWKQTPWATAPAQASWTWPGQEGKPLKVEVYSRCERVKLYLNDKELGEKPATQAEAFKAVFEVPYAAGTLRAVGYDGKRAAAECVLNTAGEAAQVALTPDRAKLKADGQDLAFVEVEVTDAEGRWRPDARDRVDFSISGPGRIIGVSNGDLSTTEPYQAASHRVHQGRALVVVRAGREPGEIELTARTGGLKGGIVRIGVTK